MPAARTPRVPVEERLFSLVLALLATDSGLSKTEILSTVQGYRQKYSRSGDNAALERQFERDKDDIRELGVPLETIDDPAAAFAGRHALIATVDGADVGLVVSSSVPEGTELSRVWTDPRSRGRGVGTALLTAALSGAVRPVRLSVWEWREPAVRMYRATGFEVVPSWDDRPGLMCLELR